MIQVLRLCISPGHNFFGHHGQPPGAHPLADLDEIECVAGRGIRGDRFFDYADNYKGQITFVAADIFEALKRELNVPDVDFSATRRNALLSGADLAAFIGKEFEIQGVHFFGTESCKPCYWMNTALHPKAEAWLQNRGGLRARILTSGILRRGVACSAPMAA